MPSSRCGRWFNPFQARRLKSGIYCPRAAVASSVLSQRSPGANTCLRVALPLMAIEMIRCRLHRDEEQSHDCACMCSLQAQFSTHLALKLLRRAARLLSLQDPEWDTTAVSACFPPQRHQHPTKTREFTDYLVRFFSTHQERLWLAEKPQENH